MEINGLITKLKVNKREYKGLIKRYQALIAARDKHVFKDDDLSDE